MNRYTFCFTKKELKEFSIRAVLEQYRRRGRVLSLIHISEPTRPY